MTASTTTVAVTGHRALPSTAPALIRGSIRQLVDRFPGATWLTGGAVGTDALAADELLRLGQTVELVLPFYPAVQSAKWTPAQRQRLADHLGQASAVEMMRIEYAPAGYRERNMRLVERADLLMAVWNGTSCGGTAFTVHEAARRGKPIYWLPVR